jgi:hypothetical protein
MKHLTATALALIATFGTLSCKRTGEHARFKAYVYKQLEPGGLICVFYSNTEGLAERNATIYVTDTEKLYGTVLTIKGTPY